MAKKMDEPKKSGSKNMTMKKSMKPRMAMNKTMKPRVEQSLQRTTKKLSDSQTIDSRKGTSKAEMSKNVLYGSAEKPIMKAKKAGFKNESLNADAYTSLRKIATATNRNPMINEFTKYNMGRKVPSDNFVQKPKSNSPTIGSKRKFGLDKEAKNLSKSNKGPVQEISPRYRDEGYQSMRRNLPVSTVKEKGKKTMAVGTTSFDTEGGYYKDSEMPTTNYTPKSGQSKKVVKTYEGGKLIKKEKQGRDILNRPTVKTKTTGEGGFKKGVEKKTLTKRGIKQKSTY